MTMRRDKKKVRVPATAPGTRGRRTPVKVEATGVRAVKPLPKEGFPMRINKYLAQQGYSTRRDADGLIERKQVYINGRVAQLGDKVELTDTVEVKKSARPQAYAYLAFNKPVGMNTHQEDTGTRNILDSLPSDMKRLGLFPVGRLDKDSHGLILLTNDGRITDRLLNPAHEHEKTYEVETKKPLRESFKEKMEGGVFIEGYTTKPTTVEMRGQNKFRITLTEGKSHQIRRMVAALFNEVADLKRLSIGNIKLGPMKAGGYRVIEGEELSTFLKSLGLA